jgi:alanyl-tRNA synthetase
MATITGTLNFDFETDKAITEEQFKNFKRKINKIVDDWEMMVYDAANESGFEADSFHPILLNELECDFETEE